MTQLGLEMVGMFAANVTFDSKLVILRIYFAVPLWFVKLEGKFRVRVFLATNCFKNV